MNNLKRKSNNIIDLTELCDSLKLVRLNEDNSILDSKKNERNLKKENTKLKLKIENLELKIIHLESELSKINTSPINKELSYIS